MKRVVAVIAFGCHAAPAPTAPANATSSATAPAADFCAIMTGDDQAVAAGGGVIHEALMSSGAGTSADASAALITWLHAQPCVTGVAPDPPFVPTPRTRAVHFSVPVRNSVARTCTAELRMTSGSIVAMSCTTLIDI